VNLLVDTHVLLWAIAEPARIPPRARRRIESPENVVLFSAASIWEVAIKSHIRRINLPLEPHDLIEASQSMGFLELPVTAAHAAGVARLPYHHRDPFDRLLISQATAEPARLLTADRALVAYSELVEFVE
jgi:PIN domain nuclease of toxin-antitoxin system